MNQKLLEKCKKAQYLPEDFVFTDYRIKEKVDGYAKELPKLTEAEKKSGVNVIYYGKMQDNNERCQRLRARLEAKKARHDKQNNKKDN
jgi:hypothetical protein